MKRMHPPTTEEEFQSQLEELIRAAESNGVDVAGGYRFRTNDENPDWSLELFKVVKPEKRGIS